VHFEIWYDETRIGTLGSQSVRDSERLVRVYELGNTLVFEGSTYG
jgi:hypothetical protein